MCSQEGGGGGWGEGGQDKGWTWRREKEEEVVYMLPRTHDMSHHVVVSQFWMQPFMRTCDNCDIRLKWQTNKWMLSWNVRPPQTDHSHNLPTRPGETVQTRTDNPEQTRNRELDLNATFRTCFSFVLNTCSVTDGTCSWFCCHHVALPVDLFVSFVFNSCTVSLYWIDTESTKKNTFEFSVYSF